MDIIEILSTKGASLGLNAEDIARTAFINKYLGKSTNIENVNAKIIFYNESYKHEISFRVLNGLWTKEKTKLQNKQGSPKKREVPLIIGRTTCQTCVTWYLVWFEYDLNTLEVLDAMILDEWDECTEGAAPSGYGDSPTPDVDDPCGMPENPFGSSGPVYENPDITTSAEFLSGGIPARNWTGKWNFYKGTLLTYTWWYRSTDQGVHKKPGTEWKWETLSHTTEHQVGTSPFVTQLLGVVATPTFSTDRLSATMQLDYEVRMCIDCLGIQVGCQSDNATSSKTWPVVE